MNTNLSTIGVRKNDQTGSQPIQNRKFGEIKVILLKRGTEIILVLHLFNKYVSR